MWLHKFLKAPKWVTSRRKSIIANYRRVDERLEGVFRVFQMHKDKALSVKLIKINTYQNFQFFFHFTNRQQVMSQVEKLKMSLSRLIDRKYLRINCKTILNLDVNKTFLWHFQ